MRIAVLGPLEVDEGRTLLAPRDQVVLEALAARPGDTVRAEALAEALWGEQVPASWPKVVQGCVSRLRKVLGSPAIATSGSGYRLVLHRDDFDHLCFEDLLLRAGELLAAGEPERARYASGQALGLWRGDPLDRLTEWESGRIESERLGERRRDAEDLYAEAAIRAGRHGDVLGELHRMVAQQPTRERRWGLLALAQYQAGRQAEALGTLQRARATLVNEFGLDPGPQLAELENAILRQDPALVVDGAAPVSAAVCPYLGLVAYDVGDATAYFGREADLGACLDRLDEAGVLAVVGPSGCGKSSLIRAGVAAALMRDGHAVRIVTPGAHPEDQLAQAPAGAGAVFVVDQCEEALALDETSPEREAFFAGLVAFAARGRLVLSLRADRLGELAAHPEFAHLAEKGLYLLGGMGPTELRSAIEGPAAQAGLRLEPGLVDLLVREAEGSPGALPLLSHVLRQTWRGREGDTLTVQGYAATGGVREAVAQSAERLYRELTASQQGMLRDLMVRLVSSDDAGEPVRTRVSRRTVTSDAEHTAVVEALVGARLLSSDGDTVEIAHESLAVAWPRLRSWLDDDVDGLRIMRHLTVAAQSWDELGRPDSELYRGLRQARAAEWRRGHDPELTPPERAFLDASAELADKEQRATEAQVLRERRLNQRLRLGLAVVAALLAVSIVAGALALTARDQADAAARAADRQAVVADARRLGAQAMQEPQIDRAVLLAVAGARLYPSIETRTNLTNVLDRAPQLIRVSRTTGLLSLSLSPDGRRVATAGALTGVSIFDAATLAKVVSNGEVSVASVRFDPDGSLLVGATNVWTPTGERRVTPLPLRLLDPATAKQLPTQLGGMPTERIVQQAMAFSADGRWLGAGFQHPRELDTRTAVRVWRTDRLGSPVASFELPWIVESLALTLDGRRLLATTRTGLALVEVPTGRVLRTVPLKEQPGGLIGPIALALSADGSVAVRDDDRMRLLDARTLGTRASFVERGTIGRPIAVSKDGQYLAYTVNGTVVVRSLTRPKQSVTLYPSGNEQAPWGLAFGPDSKTLYAAQGDGLLLAWDVSGERRFVAAGVVRSGQIGGDPVWRRISPDGRTVAHLVTDDAAAYSLQFLDVRTGSIGPPVATHHQEGYYIEMAWRPDSQVVATVLDDEWVRLWDRGSGALVEEHRLPGDGVTTVAFSRDGSTLAVGTRNGWVRSIGGAGRTGEAAIRISDHSVGTVALSDDGSRALASADGHVSLLDLDRGSIADFADLGIEPCVFSWAPGGGTAVVSGSDSSPDGGAAVAVLDTSDLSLRTKRVGPETAGGCTVAYSGDGRRFVSAEGNRVALWDAAGDLVGTIRRQEGTAASFTPDGSTVLLASAQGSISYWDPRPEVEVEAACQIAGRDLTTEEWRANLPGRDYRVTCPS
ncbi:MAG: BTAD domain-containing putative transcriptional regulator [Pedococcus sp.]